MFMEPLEFSPEKAIGWDVETWLIVPGCVTPKLVCVTIDDGHDQSIYLAQDGLEVMRRYLEDDTVHLVAHNTVFDLAVLCAEDPSFIPLVFRAIERGRVHCSMLREMVIDNFFGFLKFRWDEDEDAWKKQSYSLADCVWRNSKKKLAKGDDTYRLRYGTLDGVPLEEWPQAAIDYAVLDAVEARNLCLQQHKRIEEAIPYWARLMGRAWALYLASIWGFRTDRDETLKLEAEIIAEMEEYKAIAQKWGFIRKGKKQSKNQKALRAYIEEKIANPAVTPTGLTQLSREQMRSVPCECGGDFDAHKDGKCEIDGPHRGVWATSEFGRMEKKLTTYIKVLKRGFELPVQCSYNPIIETFRTSCSRPNIQNYPRKGGIRDCIIPRDSSSCFAFCDYDTLEMRSLAQVAIDRFGFSDIADAIERGEDLHVSLAAEIRGESYERTNELYLAGDPDVENERQAMKASNYGLAGGMGSDTLIEYAHALYGLEISKGKAEEAYHGFRKRWSEMPKYFEWCSDMGEDVSFVRSGLGRGRVNYTARCNGFFQHLAAMGACDAMYLVTRACYIEKDSPLYGCRPWLFAHDEIGIEIPYAAIGPKQASDAVEALREIMIAAMKYWCPDVKIEASAAMARKWAKGAKAVYQNGIMVPGVFDSSSRQWVPDRMAA